MVGFLSQPLGPQLSTGQFLGDALSGLGSGLLAYGAGGQLRPQAGLIGLQGLQQAQQLRRQNAMDALQMQYMQQRGADYAAQAAEREQEAQRQQVLQQRYNAMLGSQPRQGPVQPGQPALGSTPINPALSSLPQSIQQMLPAMDPQQGMGLIAQLATQKPQAPIVQNFEEGNDTVSKQYDPSTGKWIELSRGPKWDPNAGQANQNKLSLNPTYMTDPQGNPAIGQLGMDGQMHVVPLPPGMKVAPGVTMADLGTYLQPFSKQSGLPVAPAVQKNVQAAAAQQAAGTAVGSAQGSAQASLPFDINQSDQTISEIENLKKDPELDNAVGLKGMFFGNIPTTKAYALRQKIEQLKGGAFMMARKQLKGGGQITDYEGSRAENAYARLQSAQNKEDFVNALNDFEDAVRKGKEIMQKQAGGQSTATPAQSSAAPDPLGIR